MPQVAFFEKKFVPLSEAKVGVMTHALNYGTACFEGIRGNWNTKEGQMYLFRLKEHYERLHKSCRILKIKLAFDVEKLCQLTVDLVKKNGYRGVTRSICVPLCASFPRRRDRPAMDWLPGRPGRCRRRR